jgi:outer membrane biosynthesis protein TonB
MQIPFRLFAFSALAASLGCGGGRATDETVKPVRVLAPDPLVTCAEWVQRAVADPQIGVERVPSPLKVDPPPFPKRLPKGVLDKNGRAEVHIRVVVDTLGAPDMKTFTVVKSSHATLTRSVRTAVAKWKFSPAEVGGCKVPRNFNGEWVTGPPPTKAGQD